MSASEISQISNEGGSTSLLMAVDDGPTTPPTIEDNPPRLMITKMVRYQT